MAEYLFNQIIQKDGETPNLFWESQDALLSAIPSMEQMLEHWGVNTRDERINSAVKIEFLPGPSAANPGFDGSGLNAALTQLPPLPSGETFDLVRFIAPGVIYKGVVYTVECAEDLGIEFDIQVVKGSDGAVVQELKGIKANEYAFSVGEMLATPEIIPGGEIYLLKVKFASLPFTDANGDGLWGDECNTVPCMNLRVHALTEDTCHAPRIDMAGCCIQMPESKCEA